jgi:predicted SnoaL-like aldol condensation-catalyzing enzyme
MDHSSSASEAQEARNKAVVARYFHEVLDQKNFDLMPEIIAPDVIVHRPGFIATVLDVVTRNLRARLQDYTAFASEVVGLMADGDMVSARITHRTRVRPHTLRSRAGEVKITQGQELSWEAIVQFRLKDGKIAEEWVMRDELGMLAQLGQIAVQV